MEQIRLSNHKRIEQHPSKSNIYCLISIVYCLIYKDILFRIPVRKATDLSEYGN